MLKRSDERGQTAEGYWQNFEVRIDTSNKFRGFVEETANNIIMNNDNNNKISKNISYNTGQNT